MNNNSSLSVKHEIALINGVATRISSARSAEENTCIVVIPGNPGGIGFYDIFISTIFQAGKGRFSVYGVSHAGHAQVDEPSGPCRWKTSKQWDHEPPSSFTLTDQIEHKLAFLAYYIPAHAKVILIGHSIGAYIALEMLKRYHDKEKVLKCVLLFPTIERVDSAPSGKFWKFICHYFHWPFLVGTAFASFLPSVVQRWSIGWWMYLNKVEDNESIKAAAQSLLDYSTVDNVLEIGRQLTMIQELDFECIQSNLHKLVFFYGLGDPWVPQRYYEEMKERFPNGEIKLSRDKDIKHAFVLDTSEKVAKMVWEWIEQHIDKIDEGATVNSVQPC